MGFIAFLVLGLIAGSISRSIMGQQGSWLTSLGLGVIGALVGGWLGSILFNRPLGEFFSIYTWLMAIGGAILGIFLWQPISGRRTQV
ncbi:MAG: GlsB/YeaQ/YmgE family stress response membrane protein [Micropruina sp.]|nr:GlsB/YeaQ/YmgE family stress response membrane protein [Micropruina sp.]